MVKFDHNNQLQEFTNRLGVNLSKKSALEPAEGGSVYAEGLPEEPVQTYSGGVSPEELNVEFKDQFDTDKHAYESWQKDKQYMIPVDSTYFKVAKHIIMNDLTVIQQNTYLNNFYQRYADIRQISGFKEFADIIGDALFQAIPEQRRM
jgi:hypothetical protein